MREGSTLLFDCTNRWLLVGLVRSGREFFSSESAPRDAFQRLSPMIQNVLEEAGLQKPDCIVCTVGPGSFTGIRVGVTAGRSLAQLWKVPVLGIESLRFYCYEVFKQTSGKSGPLGVMVDGKQKRVYATSAPNISELVEAVALKQYDIAPDELQNRERNTRFFADDPDTVLQYAGPGSTLRLEALPTPRLATLFELAQLVSKTRPAGPWQELRPLYLRADSATVRFPGGFK
ncbi:MAG: tRNA (adenosine(37)-N6)-threonylcarbamoyltransferase complex dimerization subunit type 1 TsaB [Leptospiraceae bacterium]|nr:tRNA (adenosine(37)-N6)-threonylcarbamoyltransferase complex dimerization subunit type 1 TsaB [Leptospiraceae bacterium]